MSSAGDPRLPQPVTEAIVCPSVQVENAVDIREPAAVRGRIEHTKFFKDAPPPQRSKETRLNRQTDRHPTRITQDSQTKQEALGQRPETRQ